MTNNDSVTNQGKNGLFSQLSKEFADLTIDIEEISKRCSDPFFMALLLFKLAEERKETNRLLKEINEKMEKQPFQAPENNGEMPVERSEYVMLSETDQRIVALAEQKGMVDSSDVKEMLSYKCVNAASQRLNKLFREGHLKKVRSGQKVFFTAKSRPLHFQHPPTTPKSPHLV